MKNIKHFLALVLAMTTTVTSFSAEALTVAEAVNSVQSPPPASLPTIANPRGNIGYILANIFYGSADGGLNGKIRPEYLDLSGVGSSQWTASGSTLSYAGTVGIGTLNPNASYRLDVTGGIRASSGIAITAGTVSFLSGSLNGSAVASGSLDGSAIVSGSLNGSAIASGSLLFASWNENGCTFDQIPKWNGSAWACASDFGIGSETDPLWTTASGSYYTKTQLQTPGQSQFHWNNLTNVPVATTTSTGIVMLENSTGSISTTKAPTAWIVNSMWTSLVAMIDTKVSGSGSANSVAKFVGGMAVGISQIFDDGSNVGIGTSTPTQKLEVAGNIRLSGVTPTYRMTNVANPVDNSDAANKGYVDTTVSAAGGTASKYLADGSYYSEWGDPYFCKLNSLVGTTQKIVSVNQNQLCDTANQLYCNAGTCSATAGTLSAIKDTNRLISARDDKSCSISNGQLYCWGYTGYGQKYLDFSLSAFNNGGESHACAVLPNGQVKCWGRGDYGQLGNGASVNSSVPVAVTGISNAVKVYNVNLVRRDLA